MCGIIAVINNQSITGRLIIVLINNQPGNLDDFVAVE